MLERYLQIYSKSEALSENRVHLQTSRRFAEGALIGQVARFIQMQTGQIDHGANFTTI